MTRRFTAVATVLGLALATLVVFSPTAHAQDTTPACFPEQLVDYPPNGEDLDLENLTLLGGDLDPGSTISNLAVGNAEPGADYCGRLYSAVITLPVTAAEAGGTLRYSGINVPTDFKVPAPHHLDIYRSGSLVGAFDFCVKTDGSIVDLKSCPKTVTANTNNNGNLPKTGVDRLMEVLRVALVLLAVGALMVYGRRRMAARTARTA